MERVVAPAGGEVAAGRVDGRGTKPSVLQRHQLGDEIAAIPRHGVSGQRAGA